VLAFLSRLFRVGSQLSFRWLLHRLADKLGIDLVGSACLLAINNMQPSFPAPAIRIFLRPVLFRKSWRRSATLIDRLTRVGWFAAVYDGADLLGQRGRLCHHWQWIADGVIAFSRLCCRR